MECQAGTKPNTRLPPTLQRWRERTLRAALLHPHRPLSCKNWPLHTTQGVTIPEKAVATALRTIWRVTSLGGGLPPVTAASGVWTTRYTTLPLPLSLSLPPYFYLSLRVARMTTNSQQEDCVLLLVVEAKTLVKGARAKRWGSGVGNSRTGYRLPPPVQNKATPLYQTTTTYMPCCIFQTSTVGTIPRLCNPCLFPF